MNISSKYRTHTCGGISEKDVGANVVLSGWLHRKRDHGGLLFVDLRDNYGITQCVVDLADSALAGVEKIHPESVITIRGSVVLRTPDQINDKIPTGRVEVKVANVEVLTEAAPLPFQVFGEEETNEELRLTYRYLAQRRDRLHANVLGRNRIVKFIRDKMWGLGFSDFQTPILTVSSPEGARDFLVPSRLHHGEFYALPQAPQQFKQLLMLGGFDRYFQISPCFRDEDLRADRLIEFYQLDVEMSFAEVPEIQKVFEEVITSTIREFAPNVKLSDKIPHISHAEAALKYGSDKPDLRNPIVIADVSEIFAASDFAIFADAVKGGAVVRAIPAPNTADKPRSFFDKMGEFATKELGLGGLGYIVYAPGEAKGPVAKKLTAEQVAAIKTAAGAKDGDTIFFVCDKKYEAAKAAGKIRIKLGEDLGLIDASEYKLCWVDDFPMYELNEETGAIDFGHNPFSLPKGSLDGNPLEILANQYDMVLNGWEICSGGLRNYNPDMMIKAFKIAGYTEEDVKTKFSGLWTAFQYGVPPHGGFAAGIDRIVCILLGEPNLRECVAFTTNQRGQDLMLGSPRAVSELQLREAHIQIRKKG
ncbi:MAG: aspartate--tRNA ligase [Rickettsiales bacterium]|jgi:aspartyl-tRNA synthetase|nr:aspartate--tRNA ligase [Rickettsiales bacterium]